MDVYIDEKRASVEDLLTLPSRRVARVEYIDAPGVEYTTDPSIVAVIKIYLREPQSGLAGGAELGNFVTTLAGENYGFLRYNWSRSEVGLSLQSGYVHVGKRRMDQVDKYALTDERVVTVDKKGVDRPLQYTDNKLTLHYTYSRPESDLISLVAAGTWYDSQMRPSEWMVTEGHLPTYRATASPTEKYLSPELDFFALHRFSDGGALSANLHGTYISTDYGYRYQEVHPTAGDRSYGYSTEGVKRSLIGEAKYQRQLVGQTLSIGGRYLIGGADNLYHSLDQSEGTSHLLNQDLYLYAQLSGDLSGLRYNVGLGTNMQATKQGDAPYLRTWLLRPSLGLSYSLRDLTLQYNLYSSSIGPTLSMLSPVRQRFNTYEIRSGSPSLKPYLGLTNALTLRKPFGERLFTSLFVRHQYFRNPVVPIVLREQDGGDEVLNHTFVNDGWSQSFRASLSLQWQVVPDLLTLAGSLGHDITRFKNSYYDHRLSHTSYSLDCDLTWKGWELMGSWYSREKFLEGETITTNSSNLYLSLTKQFGPWSLGLAANHLFHPLGTQQIEDNLSALHSMHQDLVVPSMGNMIGVTISYFFSHGRSYEGGERTITQGNRIRNSK